MFDIISKRKDIWSAISRYLPPIDRISLVRAIPPLKRYISHGVSELIPEDVSYVTRLFDDVRLQYQVYGTGLRYLLYQGTPQGYFYILVPKVDTDWVETLLSDRKFRIYEQPRYYPLAYTMNMVGCEVSIEIMDFSKCFRDIRRLVSGEQLNTWVDNKQLHIWLPHFFGNIEY